MLRSDYEDQNCGIAAGLEVIGERWTLLIVRDALLGVRRFEDFQARLGVSRKPILEYVKGTVPIDVQPQGPAPL